MVVAITIVVALVVCSAGYTIYKRRSAQPQPCSEKYKEQERNYFIGKGDIKGTETNNYANLNCPDRGTLAPAPMPQ